MSSAGAGGAGGTGGGRFDQSGKADELDGRTAGRKTSRAYSPRADREGDCASSQSHLLRLESRFAVGLHHERATGLDL